MPASGVGLPATLILREAASGLEAAPWDFGWTPNATATIRTTTAPGIMMYGF